MPLHVACESKGIDPNLMELLLSGDEMRRDLDYMRQLLAELEEADDWQFHLLSVQGRPLKVDNKRAYHIMLLRDGGLLKEMAPGIFRMTAGGHDFLDHTRDQDVWDKSKQAMSKLKDHSLAMLTEVAKGFVRAKLIEYGVPLA